MTPDQEFDIIARALELSHSIGGELLTAPEPVKMTEQQTLAVGFAFVFERWATVSESIRERPPLARCGWCVAAAGDDQAAWTAAPEMDLAAIKAHTLVCPLNPPVKELAEARAELVRIRPVYVLACELQDSDQCEDHCVGDECQTGDVENELFPALSKARIDADDHPKIDTVRGPQTPTPSTANHVLNCVDECVSWCVACRENRERGFNADGTKREVTRG